MANITTVSAHASRIRCEEVLRRNYQQTNIARARKDSVLLDRQCELQAGIAELLRRIQQKHGRLHRAPLDALVGF